MEEERCTATNDPVLILRYLLNKKLYEFGLGNQTSKMFPVFRTIVYFLSVQIFKQLISIIRVVQISLNY